MLPAATGTRRPTRPTRRRNERLHASRSLARWGVPLLQYFSAVTLYRHGEWDDALAEVDAGLDAADETGMRMTTFWPDAVACLVMSARGESDRARQHLDHASRTAPRSALGGEWIAYAAVLAAEAEGDLDAAGRIAGDAGEAILTMGVFAPLLNGGPELVRICAATGRTDLAVALADALTTITTRTASPIAAALAAGARGFVSGDASAVAGAADQLDTHGRVPEAARTRHAAAVMAARRGELTDAKRHAKQAFAAYDALAAGTWHRQLRAELHDAGLPMRPRRRVEAPMSGWPSLTASEQTIVQLVGSGLTNSEIAARLFVSRRTVESHLGRVYTKLDVATRSQLVAAVVRRLDAGTTREAEIAAGRA